MTPYSRVSAMEIVNITPYIFIMFPKLQMLSPTLHRLARYSGSRVDKTDVLMRLLKQCSYDQLLLSSSQISV